MKISRSIILYLAVGCTFQVIASEAAPHSISANVICADWLVNPSPYTASIREDKARSELVMENGLVRRVLRTTPDLATISYRLLPDGDEFLRATSPEARITIDSVEYPIGGLTGQPIGNYLKEDWLKNLRKLPNAYNFTGWSEGPIEARFGWKKRPEWLSRETQWPAPGRHLMLRFAAPAVPPKALAITGPLIVEDDFLGALKPEWKTRVSTSHPRSSFTNEGKAGEIYTPSETAVYAERPWPQQGRSVEVTVDSGDDTLTNAWGPGLTLLADNTSLLHFIIRPNQKVYSINGQVYGSFDRAKPQRLRVTLEQEQMICEAAPENGEFKHLATLPLNRLPTHIRVGKCGRDGKGEDLPGHNPKDIIRCHVSHFSIHGLGVPLVLKSRTDLPEVTVHYNIYDGLPLIEKWLTLKNTSDTPCRINRTLVEELRYAEEESQVEAVGEWIPSRIFVETDYTYCSMSGRAANRFSVLWKTDPTYKTQVSYDLKTPCLLEVAPEFGPAIDLKPGEDFTSIRCFQMVRDSTDRERTGLAQRRFYRTAAPWVQENPIFCHLISSDPIKIRGMIDQASEVGFEMVILSFGSGLNMENRDPAYQAKYKELSDYAASKGVVLGSYSLLASRGADKPANNCGGPGARVKFGTSPCLGSSYGLAYLKQMADFMQNTGFNVFEHDGSYSADTCAHTNHPGHRDLADSQWRQWQGITNLYRDCRSKGIYLNIPDWYYLNGSSKCGMGYREINWSKPRAEQEIIERQNIYDGTWEKTASMGWMFVPLTEYHGGGVEATIEPLKDHLPHYETRLANLLGAGVQAIYRGPRLYDTEETKQVVKKWVSFYKTHRQVLDGDIIHLRRPDGRDWDGILHVNPQGEEKAMAFLYNPLETDLEREIRLPLYYAGLSGSVQVSVETSSPQPFILNPQQTLTLKVKIPARSRTWILIK